MKNFIVKIISLITCILLKQRKSVKVRNSIINFLSIKNIGDNNDVDFNGCSLKKVKIMIEGKNNIIELKNNLSNTAIRIIGNNNSLIIDSNSYLRKSEIIIRGEDCTIKIGRNSTFGNYAYMVCMGKHNFIRIGDNCMFSDNIDIWNTDSHPIYDENHNLLNNSKPIIVEDNVWIGKYSKILKNSVIRKGAVIGMNSVVTSNIKESSLNVGIPSRCIRDNIKWEKKFIEL